MSTFSIAHIPQLGPHVRQLLDSPSSLDKTASDVLGLVPDELGFSLLLEGVLPVLTDSQQSTPMRMAALFVLASSHSADPASDPFRSSYANLLQSEMTKSAPGHDTDDDVEGVASTLGWAALYILAGMKDRLGPYTALDVSTVPFPLPTGDTFGLSLASQTARASSSRSRETSPTRDSLAQLVRLTHIAKARALSSREERIVHPLASTYADLLTSLFPATSLHLMAQLNPDLTAVFLSHLLGNEAAPCTPGPYLESLATLSPSLASLELLSKLLRKPGSLRETIKSDVMGRFLGRAIGQLDELELRRRAGESQVEEELARTVNVLCRFLLSLLHSSTLHPSDALLVEATSFTLRFSRLPQAQYLYRALLGTEDTQDEGLS